jgi:hypothetical protein
MLASPFGSHLFRQRPENAPDTVIVRMLFEHPFPRSLRYFFPLVFIFEKIVDQLLKMKLIVENDRFGVFSFSSKELVDDGFIAG